MITTLIGSAKLINNDKHFFFFVGHNVWKYHRNDIQSETYDELTIHSLQSEQELSVDGASLRSQILVF